MGTERVTGEYILKHPVVIGNEEVKSLTFRRAKGKDMAHMTSENPKMGEVFQMYSKLCEVPPSTILELDAEDIGGLSEALQPFLPRGQATGEKA